MMSVVEVRMEWQLREYANTGRCWLIKFGQRMSPK
jgi:hypothetical protein